MTEPMTQYQALIERLEAVEMLCAELADDLEAELRARWFGQDGACHPALQSKFDRDMDVVNRARNALSSGGKANG